MTQILVDKKGLSTLKSELNKSAAACNECNSCIYGVKMHLDMSISAAGDIITSLNSLYKVAIKQQKEIEEYAAAVEQVNSLFTAKDNELKKNMRLLSVGLDTNLLSRTVTEVLNGRYNTGDMYRNINKEILEFLKNSVTNGSMGLVGIGIYKLLESNGWGLLKEYKYAGTTIKSISDLCKVFDAEWPGTSPLFDNAFLDTIGYVMDGEKLLEAIETGDEKVLEELAEKYVKKLGKTGAGLVGVKGLAATEAVYAAYNFGEHLTHIDQFIGPNSGNSFGEGLAKYAFDVVEGTTIETQFDIAHDILDPIYKLLGKDLDKIYEETVGATGYEGVKKGVKDIFDTLKFMGSEEGSGLKEYIVNDITSGFKSIFSKG